MDTGLVDCWQADGVSNREPNQDGEQNRADRTPLEFEQAGANGLGSGVRLGTQEFDCDVALAGRVYCNTIATTENIEPGDLLTTSSIPGFAMKVTDFENAHGAILGKAMESLEKGKKGQILVLVTLH